MTTPSNTKPAGKSPQGAKASKHKETDGPQGPACQVPDKPEPSTNPGSPPQAAINQVLGIDAAVKAGSQPKANNPVELEEPSAPAGVSPVNLADLNGAEQREMLWQIKEKVEQLDLGGTAHASIWSPIGNILSRSTPMDGFCEFITDPVITQLRRDPDNQEACAYSDMLEAGLSPGVTSDEAAEAADAQASEIKPEHSENRDTAENPEFIRVVRTIISKWNRSFGLDLDKEAIKKLAASIKKHGLLHPIILVRIPGKENWYAIVCGAHRFEAIKLNRKGDAFLRPGEYHILPDLTEEDDACLDISVSENADRNDLSPYATARYVKRLQKEEGLDQTVIAGRLGMQREVVNALTVLPEHYADLPEKWQKGLNTVCDSDHSTKLVITVSHWRKVKAYVEKHGMTQELHDLLEAAADKKWSTKRLGDEVGDLKEADKGGGPGGDDGCPTISSGKGSTEPEGNGDNGGTEEGADNPDDPQPDHQEASELAGILEAAIKLKDQAREYDNIVQLLNPVIEEVEKMQKAAAKEEAA